MPVWGMSTPNQQMHDVFSRMPDAELRSSLLTIGPILPVYQWNGMVIDGARRLDWCNRLGISIRKEQLESRKAAACLLWALHPDRCLTVFHCRTLDDCAELYGSTPARVASVRAGAFPRPPEPAPLGRGWVGRHQVDRIDERSKCVKVQFWISRADRESMFRARKAQGGTSEAAFIRRAIFAAVESAEEEADMRIERVS